MDAQTLDDLRGQLSTYEESLQAIDALPEEMKAEYASVREEIMKAIELVTDALQAMQNIEGEKTTSATDGDRLLVDFPIGSQWRAVWKGALWLVEVVGAEPPKLKTKICHPTCSSQLLCSFYEKGQCTRPNCSFSHGLMYLPFELSEAEAEQNRAPCEAAGSKLFAKYTDSIWYPAVLDGVATDKFDKKHFVVTFESYGNTETLDASEVIPRSALKVHLDNPQDSSEGDSSDSGDVFDDRVDNDEDLENTVRVLGDGIGMGQWEQHTKGIGSRLLMKMGYVMGQGLGRKKEGRVDPVAVRVLPQGVALDFIDAQEAPVVGAKKRRRGGRKAQARKERKKQAMESRPTEDKTNVFEFMNKTLADAKPNDKSAEHPRKSRVSSDESKENLQKRYAESLHRQQHLSSQIQKLEESLERNKLDKTLGGQIQAALANKRKALAEEQHHCKVIQQSKDKKHFTKMSKTKKNFF